METQEEGGSASRRDVLDAEAHGSSVGQRSRVAGGDRALCITDQPEGREQRMEL